jgi:hypothetical protein
MRKTKQNIYRATIDTVVLYGSAQGKNGRKNVLLETTVNNIEERRFQTLSKNEFSKLCLAGMVMSEEWQTIGLDGPNKCCSGCYQEVGTGKDRWMRRIQGVVTQTETGGD